MQRLNSIWRPVALAGLFTLLAACGQDHGDHGHAHEGDADHAHEGEHAHDDHVHHNAPETEAFYADETDDSTEVSTGDPAGESAANADNDGESVQTEETSHSHVDGEVHAH